MRVRELKLGGSSIVAIAAMVFVPSPASARTIVVDPSSVAGVAASSPPATISANQTADVPQQTTETAPTAQDGAAPATGQGTQASGNSPAGQEPGPAAADVVVVARGQGTRDARATELQTVDAVGPRDIDSLPSQNVSDVLKRLPGVQVTYDNGEAQQPNIRGVGYIQTTIDGREVSTAAFRALQIGDVPGDIVNSVEVFKTPSANQIEGGIGGLIAIKTKQPFDFHALDVTGQLSMSLDDKRGKPLPQGSIAIGDSFDTGIGRIGFSVAYDHTAVLLRSDFSITSYAKGAGVFDLNKNGVLGDSADTAIYPASSLPIEINAEHRRDAVVGNLEWAPTSELTFAGAVLYDRYLDQSQQYSLSSSFGPNNSAADAASFTLNPNDPVATPLVQSGTFANVPITAQSLYVRPFRQVWQESLSGSWVHDRLTISAQGDLTQSQNNNDILIFGATGTAPNVTYNGVNSPGLSTVSVSGLNITNPASFTSLNYTEIIQRARSAGNSQRIDLEYRSDGFLTALQVGYRHVFRRSDSNQAFASTPVNGTLASIPGLATLSPSGDFANANPNLFIDELGFRGLIGLPQQLPAFSPASFFELRERVNAAYVRALYKFTLFGVPIDGDLGVRGVFNANSGSAYEISAAGAAPITNSGTDNDWLPSGTLRAKLTDKLTARFSGSRTVARPDFTQLSPGLTLNADLTGSGGNPNLKSFYATGFDLGFDWLYSPSGYATIAFFTKTLSGLVENQVNLETINGQTYRISRPFNGTSDSSFRGIEINFNKKFVELPGLLSGIGVDANYTYLDSQLTNAAGVRTRIPGLATHTFNGSIYYDRGPLLLRVGYTITSDFVNNANYGGVPDLGGQEIFGRQDVMDATVQFRLNRYIRLTANAMNALQPAVGYYNGFVQTPDNSYRTYRRYQFGVKFDF